MMARWTGRTYGMEARFCLKGLALGLALAAVLLALSSAAPISSHAAPSGCVPGPHSGNITTDQTWCLADSPHTVNGVTVTAGVTVTIEPGVKVQSNPGTGLDVYGTLVAEGTSTQPITFTPKTDGTLWAGVVARNGATLRLAHCDVGYAGGDYWKVAVSVYSGANAQVRHCRIHHMAGAGLKLFGGGLTGVFEDLEIDHNALEAVWQETVAMNPTYVNLRLHDNGTDAVVITGSNVDRDVTLDGSPAALNGAPIHFEGGYVTAGHTLTVTPGTLLKLREGFTLDVYGALVAEGDTTHPITLTARSANWGGVVARNGATLRLTHCDVGYAGGDYWKVALSVYSGADVQVRHCRVHHMAGSGLKLFGGGLTGVFEDLEIDHNTLEAVWQETVAMNPTYVNLRLHDNGTDAVVITTSNVDRNVTLDGSSAALNGAPIHLDFATVTAGTTLTVKPGTLLKLREGWGGLILNSGGTLIVEGTPTERITLTAQSGYWNGVVANSGSHLRLAYCDLGYAGGDYWHRAVQVNTSDAQIRSCRIHHSQGNGMNVEGVQITVRNLAVVDSALMALRLTSGARVDGLHLTLARNGTGAYLDWGTTAVLTNTILAGNTTAVHVAAGGSATLNHTLWDSNTTPVVGTVSQTGHVNGPAAFAADGYHILAESEAVQRGVNVGVTNDIDGEARPLPAGTSPDLGADENPTLRHFYIYLPIVLRPSP